MELTELVTPKTKEKLEDLLKIKQEIAEARIKYLVKTYSMRVEIAKLKFEKYKKKSIKVVNE